MTNWLPLLLLPLAVAALGASDRKATQSPAVSSETPSWSPDSRRLVFSAGPSMQHQIYVMEATGGPATRLTSGEQNRWPSWSPDGRLIVFMSDRDGQAELYVMRPDGGGQHRITTTPAHEFAPMWSPRGDVITYIVEMPGSKQELWRINPDGTGAVRLDGNALYYGRGAWLPDGSRFLIAANRRPAATAADRWTVPVRVYAYEMDGSEPKAITEEGYHTNPTSSPDGASIVTDTGDRSGWSSAKGEWDLWRTDLKTGRASRLTSTADNDWGAAWSPDGRRIAFSSGLNRVYALHLIDPDGRNRVALTRTDRVPDHRDAAPAILSQAVRALTGNEGEPRLWIVEGSGRENLTAELQGLSADAPTWRAHTERVVADATTLTVGWERHTPRNDNSLRHRRFVYGPDATIVVDHANRFGRRTPGTVLEERRRALMRRIPHLLVRDLATRADAHNVGEVAVNGIPADEIRVTVDGDVPLTVVLGRSPVVPLSVSYPVYFPGRGLQTVEWRWTGWKPDARLGQVPAGHSISIGGQVFQEVTYTRFETGSPDAGIFLSPPMPPASPMAPPQPWAEAAGPASGEIAKGVHVARLGGFTILFAELADGIVAFEAPEPFFGTESIPASNRTAGGTLTPQVIAHIQKVIPNKAIRRVVISHHHGDHMGGLQTFTDLGAEILVPSQDLPAAKYTAGATRPQPAATPPGASVRIRGVAAQERLGDATREIVVMNVGRNPHTDGNLVLWLPAESILIQGDLFYFDAGMGFHAGRDRMNRFFAEWLRKRNITPRMVYGVHNSGAAGPAAIDAAWTQGKK